MERGSFIIIGLLLILGGALSGSIMLANSGNDTKEIECTAKVYLYYPSGPDTYNVVLDVTTDVKNQLVHYGSPVTSQDKIVIDTCYLVNCTGPNCPLIKLDNFSTYNLIVSLVFILPILSGMIMIGIQCMKSKQKIDDSPNVHRGDPPEYTEHYPPPITVS